VSAPDPPFGPEHEAFRAECRAFVEAELRPHAADWEAAKHFPDAVFGRLAEDGYLGIKYPEALGGLGRDHLFDAVWTEELSRCGSGGLAAGIGAHTGIATPPVWTFGSERHHERYLRPAIAGRKIAALAITEPGAGSDVASLRTRARRVDGGWVVNGAKTYITNGVRAAFYVTAVKTTEAGGHHGISFLIVDAQDGIRAAPLEKLGWHASDTAEVFFDDAWVPEENLLGREHEGFALIMANFQWERLLMALGAVGGMQAAWERALATPLPRARMAELATALETGRAITYNGLGRFAAGANAVAEVTQAKLFTQRAAFDFHDALLDAMGDDPNQQRAARDARLGPIGGGTDEIMKEILSRTLAL
jgi:acyl-CoA dehydrogenase